ncbi:MAG: DUF2442 domain-containing protein [Desulfobacterales bacterium]|nr:DUF2442 domain-containing protein [Desulfobacterales bacterium]
MKNFPKIKNVAPMANKRLLVTFSNNVTKIYDCSSLIDDETFKPLLNDSLFKTVKADKHGYGISWNDELDLSESELWLNGIMVENQAVSAGSER